MRSILIDAHELRKSQKQGFPKPPTLYSSQELVKHDFFNKNGELGRFPMANLRRLTHAAAPNASRRVRYYAPFDGTRGSEPSMVARAREIHGARSLVGPAGTRTMAADRPGRRSALSAPGTPCRRARVRRHRLTPGLLPSFHSPGWGVRTAEVRYQTRRCWS